MRFQLLLLESEYARRFADEVEIRRTLERAFMFGRQNQIINLTGFIQNVVRLYALALHYHIEEAYVRYVILTLQIKPAGLAEVPPNWPWPLRVNALGGLKIESKREPIKVTGRQRRVLELLLLLIAYHSNPLNKEQVKRLLWADAETGKAEQNFKSTVVRLRKLLGIDVVIWRETVVQLDKNSVWVDCWEVERLLASPPANLDERQDRCRNLSATYKGTLPEMFDQPWILPYKDELHEQCCSMFATTAQALLAAGDNASAVDISRMGRRIDDTVEAFYQAQISAHIQMDEPAKARRVYDTCLKVLEKKRRALPSAKTRALILDT